MSEKIDYGLASYLLGVISIVEGVLSPFTGLVIGIIGVVLSGKQKTETADKAKKLNITGIVVSIIFLIIFIIVTYLLKIYYPDFGFQGLG